MNEKTYRGRRTEPSMRTASETVVTVQDNVTRQLDTLEHRVLHSPSGMAWGYGGSGPADLARSILWDHLGHAPDAATYQDFKNEIIAAIDTDDWAMSTAEIDGWLEARTAEAVSGG